MQKKSSWNFWWIGSSRNVLFILVFKDILKKFKAEQLKNGKNFTTISIVVYAENSSKIVKCKIIFVSLPE